MKIFNVENGKEKAYLTLGDIGMIIHSFDLVPNSLLKIAMENRVTKDNFYKFVEFTNPEDIEYIKSLDWILDFKQYFKLSSEEIAIKNNEFDDELNEARQKLNQAFINHDSDADRLHLRCTHIGYKKGQLFDLISMKRGLLRINFPEVPDSEGLYLISDNVDEPFIARQGIDPLQILFSRTDGKLLTKENTNIPILFQMAAEDRIIKEVLGSRTDDNQYFLTNRKYLEGNKYFISTYGIIPSYDRPFNLDEITNKNRGLK